MNTRKRLTTLVLLAGFLTLGVPSPANAAVNVFFAVLNSGQIPGGESTGNAFGVAFLTFDPDSDELCFSLSYEGIDSNETAAHIHGPGVPGSNGAVVFDISEPQKSPKNLCVGPVGGNFLKELRRGKLYFVIHSEQNARGEIRGQILPARGARSGRAAGLARGARGPRGGTSGSR